LAPGRRQELEAEELSALRPLAVRRLADQRAVAYLQVLSVRRLRREAVSFRRQAACPEVPLASQQPEASPLAERLALSSSCHLHREAARRCAAEASSVPRRQAASPSKAFRPEVPRSTVPRSTVLLSKAPWSAVLSLWAAFPWGLPPVCAFRRRPAGPCAHRPEASSIHRQVVSSLWQPEVSWWLPPVVLSAWCAQAVSNSREAAAVGSDAMAAQPPAEPGALVQPPVAVRQAVSAAAAVLQQEAAGVVWDAAEGPQRAAAVSDVEAEPRQAAEEALDAVAVPRPVVVSPASRRAAGLSAAPWAFRRDRPLPSVR
jgi:hypothetical protein